MAWSFPIATGDVIEVTYSYVALDQLIQYKFDVLISGSPIAETSDTLRVDMDNVWTAFTPYLGSSTKHAQTRLQKITDCILGPTGKPKRVRGALDKTGPTTALDGVAAGPFAPLISTVSVQLITAGAPKQFWGKKGFGQVPISVLATDGAKLTLLARTNWDAAATAFFTVTTPFGTGGGSYNAGILPTTYVSNLPLPHGAMSGYFWNCIAVEVGYYAGSQKTRDIEPQTTLGH
jgi:hypothetical protein